MLKLILFALLAVVCWPAALAVLLLYPVVWLLTLPFRLVGLAVEGVFTLLGAILFAPVRLMRAL